MDVLAKTVMTSDKIEELNQSGAIIYINATNYYVEEDQNDGKQKIHVNFSSNPDTTTAIWILQDNDCIYLKKLSFFKSSDYSATIKNFRAVTCLAKSTSCDGVEKVIGWGNFLPDGIACCNKDKKEEIPALFNEKVSDDNESFYPVFFTVSDAADQNFEDDKDANNISNIDKEKIIRMVANTMMYVHDQGIIHRGIRLSAIKKGPDNKFYISSWNKSRDNTKGSGTTYGDNDTYAAPESRTGNYTNKVDVYSFGKLLGVLTENVLVDDRITKLISKCTCVNPDKRPSFLEINKILDEMDCIIPDNDVYEIKEYKDEMKKRDNERAENMNDHFDPSLFTDAFSSESDYLRRIREIEYKAEHGLVEYVHIFAALLFSNSCIPTDKFRAIKLLKSVNSSIIEKLKEDVFVQGVLLELDGNIREAIDRYEECLNSNDKWIKIEATTRIAILNKDVEKLFEVAEESYTAKYYFANTLSLSDNPEYLKKAAVLYNKCLNAGITKAAYSIIEILFRLIKNSSTRDCANDILDVIDDQKPTPDEEIDDRLADYCQKLLGRFNLDEDKLLYKNIKKYIDLEMMDSF